MNNNIKPQVRKLTEGLYYVTEEPGDWTHYSFVIAVLPKGQTFLDSIYDVTVFPAKAAGVTVSMPLYEDRLFFFKFKDLLSGKNVWEQMQVDAVALFHKNFRPDSENIYTTASAIRCALAAIEAADSSEA